VTETHPILIRVGEKLQEKKRGGWVTRNNLTGAHLIAISQSSETKGIDLPFGRKEGRTPSQKKQAFPAAMRGRGISSCPKRKSERKTAKSNLENMVRRGAAFTAGKGRSYEGGENRPGSGGREKSDREATTTRPVATSAIRVTEQSREKRKKGNREKAHD